MRKTVVIALGVVLMLIAAAPVLGQPASGMPTEVKVTATAGPGPMGMCKMGSMPQMAEMPKLTKSQRKQLFDLHYKFFNETAQFKFDLAEKRQELNDLWDADSPDGKAILAKWSEIDALELKLREKTVDHCLKLRKITGKKCPGGMGMGMGMCQGMGMGQCSGMGCGMMGDNMMPGMGGMGQGPQMIRIEKRMECPGSMPEGGQ
jgi:Spy/CpxP family protein refolding chaperone